MKKSLLVLFLILCVSSWSQAQQDGKAVLTFDRTKIDMGKISSKEKHLLRFPYANAGKTPIIIGICTDNIIIAKPDPGLILKQQSSLTNSEL